MPTHRKPGRPRKDEIEERLVVYTLHDKQVLKEHDTWLEIDVSTPTQPNQVMKIDKVDYESFRSDLVGRFFCKPSSYHDNQPVAYVHVRIKEGGFNTSPNLVHSLICKHRGYLWHRNNDPLDNRRSNLETNLPLQTSTVGTSKPIYKPEPYDHKATHEVIDLITGQPEAMEPNNETQEG